MDKTLIEKYKREMLEMYRTSHGGAIPTIAEAKSDTTFAETFAQNDTTGGLIVVVTSVRSLYPVENALVTVFSGDNENRNVIDSDLTDQSGRTKRFLLKTPQKSLSLDSNNTVIPYAVYSVEIKAEGYADVIYLNIPIFSDTTSVQRANLTLLETLGKDNGPFVFDESQKYDLESKGNGD